MSSKFAKYRSAKLPKSDRLGICLLKADNYAVIKNNPVLRSMLGKLQSEIEGKSFLDFFSKSDRKRLRAGLKECARDNKFVKLAGLDPSKSNKQPFQIDLCLQVFLHEGEVFIQVIADKHLIVESVKIDECEALDGFDAVILVSKLKIFDCDERFAKLLGKSAKRLRGSYLNKVFDSESCKNLRYCFNKKNLSDCIAELNTIGSGKSIIHFEGQPYSIRIGNKQLLKLHLRDVSSFVKKLGSMQEVVQSVKVLWENIHYGFFIYDLDINRVVYLNEYARNHIGGLKEPFEALDPFDLIAKKSGEKVKKMLNLFNNGSISDFRDEIELILPDGETTYIVFDCSYIKYDERRYIHGIYKDISTEVEAKIALEESEERFRQMAENIREIFWIVERNPIRTIYVSPHYEEVFGLPLEAIYKDNNAYLKVVHPDDYDRIANRLDRKEAEIDVEYRIIHPSGQIRWLRSRSFPIRDQNGKIYRTAGIVRDITQRKETERKIRESERKYKSVVDNVGIGISLISPEMKILSLNNQMKKWFPNIDDSQYPLCYKSFPGPRHNKICKRCPVSKTLHDGQRHETVFEDKTNKKNRSFRVVTSPLIDDNGNVVAAIELIEDITKRLEAEAEIQKFKRIADKASYAVGITDMSGKLIYINASMAQMHRMKHADMIGRPIYEFHTRIHMKKVKQLWNMLLNEGSLSAVEIWHKRSDGTVFPTLMSMTLIKNKMGKPLYTSASVIDITEMKHAETALRESEERYRAVVEDIPALVCRFRKVGSLTFVNQVFCRYYDTTCEDAVGKSFFDLVPKGSRKMVRSKFKSLSKKSPVTSFELELRESDDSLKWQLWIVHALFDENSRISEYQSIGYDVTERKKAEIALRESEQQFRLLAQHSPDMIAIQADDEAVYINQAGAEMMGAKSPQDMLGSNLINFVPPHRREFAIDRISKVLKYNKSYDYIEDQAVRMDGKIIDIEIASMPLQIKGKPAIQFLARDISQKKKAERALRSQHDMLKAVTSEVIRVQEEERRRISMELHDSIGQALSLSKLQLQNILKNVNCCKDTLSPKLKDVIQHITNTISDLRKISADLRPVILDNLGLMLSIEWYLKDFGKKVEMKIEIEIGDDVIKLDPRHEAHVFRIIQEIMINIHKHAGASKVKFRDHIENGEAVFEIRENGRGFEPDNIFEVGTRKQGMGLINIMERVELVKGKIEVYSKPGKGATYIVRIPLSKQSAVRVDK